MSIFILATVLLILVTILLANVSPVGVVIGFAAFFAFIAWRSWKPGQTTVRVIAWRSWKPGQTTVRVIGAVVAGSLVAAGMGFSTYMIHGATWTAWKIICGVLATAAIGWLFGPSIGSGLFPGSTAPRTPSKWEEFGATPSMCLHAAMVFFGIVGGTVGIVILLPHLGDPGEAGENFAFMFKVLAAGTAMVTLFGGGFLYEDIQERRKQKVQPGPCDPRDGTRL